MMGWMMFGMVLIGMSLSIYQLIAELIARGRGATLLANNDQLLKELYSSAPATTRAQVPAAAPAKAA